MIEESITSKINKALRPSLLFVENESGMHSGPRTESHFKVYVVSDAFEGMMRIERQRIVNNLMEEDFNNGLHALTMRLRTLKEHEEKGMADFISPTCSSKTPINK